MRPQLYSLWPVFGLFFLFTTAAPLYGQEVQFSLKEAVEIALKNNLNLKLKKVDLAEAEGVTESAQGTFDTLLSAEAGHQNQLLTPLVAGGVEEETTDSWNAALKKRFTPGTEVELSWNNNYLETNPSSLYQFDPIYKTSLTLGISQPLLKGFGQEVQTAQIRASEKKQKATAYLVSSEAADLVADVKKAYWELVYSWQDIAVKKLSLDLAEKLLADIKERISVGKLADVEVFRPESEVARRQESLITGERAIGFAEDNLKFLINADDWQETLTPQADPKITIIHPEMSKVLENALSNRPDLQAAELLTQAAQIQKVHAHNKTLPALALVGSLGAGGTADTYGDSLDNSINDSDTLWSVGIKFSVPLDNSFAKGNYRQAQAAVHKARTTTELLQQQVRRTVRTTVRDVNLAIKAMEATEKTTLASIKGLEAEQTKFDAGRATTLDVLVAQDSYSQALSQENRAKITYSQILAELDRIQGVVSLPEEGR